MICLLHFSRPDAKYRSCGSAFALPPPSLGVSSLDLGRWRASGLFFDSEALLPCAVLRFTHTGCRHLAVESCATQWHLLRRGNTLLPLPVVGVSSLDLGHWLAGDPFSFSRDFALPGFGGARPPVRDSASLLCGRPVGMQFLQGNFIEVVGDSLKVLRNFGECVRTLQATLVHV